MAPLETLDLSPLASFAADDLALWNWQTAFLPGVPDWKIWLAGAAAQLLREPGIATAQLIRNAPEEPSQTIALDPAQPLRLGRAPENDVVLSQVTVTRQHAELRWEQGSLWLVDLDSSLGTVVNGAKAPPHVPIELADGAEFVIFPYRFQLKLTREWVPVRDVAIQQGHQSIRSQAKFLAGHSRGWTRFLLRSHHGHIHLAVEDTLLDWLTRRMLAPLDPLDDAEFALPQSQRVWHELLVLGALAEANRSLLPAGYLTLADGEAVANAGTNTNGIEYRALLEIAGPSGAGQRGAIACFLPWAAIEGLKEHSAAPSQPTLAEQVSLHFPVSAGRVELSLSEQRTLEPGDVILYDPAPALLFPANDQQGWAAEKIGETQLALQKRLHWRHQMTDELTSLADLPLTVEIVVGHKELSLRDAQALTPGAVIDLERDVRDPVRLAVNGRSIGLGQLVTVDGRLGVRITEWSGAQA